MAICLMFPKFTVAAVVLFIFSVVSLVLGLTKDTKGQRKLWMTNFVIAISLSVILFVGGFAYKVFTTASKVKKAFKTAMEDGFKEIADGDDRTYLVDEDNPNEQVELLKSYVPDSLKDEIQDGYYTYFGFRDWYRFPLVYPYSFVCIDMLDKGYLNNERYAVDIKNSQEGIEQLQLGTIYEFSFDKNWLLAKIEKNEEIQYLAFHFYTTAENYFDNREDLLEFAALNKFEGSYDFMTFEEYDMLF